MDSAQLINLLMLAATIVQTVLAIRSQNQNGATDASSFGYDKKFVISRKRAYWLLATVVVMVISSVWAYVSSRTGFKHLPDNELTRITGQQFVDETVVLDGKDFENCTFSGVTLKYDAARNFVMRNNRFEGPLRLSWSSSRNRATAAEVIQLIVQFDMVKNGRIGFVGNGDDAVILKDDTPK
jgi:hypothetical protein